MAGCRIQGKEAAVDAGVEDGNVKPGAELLGPLRKRDDGLVGCIIQPPDFDGLAGLEVLLGRQIVAGGFALGLVSDGEDELGQAKVEELSCAFQADAAVGPRHDGCPAGEVDMASRKGRRGFGELPAEELELAGFPLGRDVECDSRGHACVCRMHVVVKEEEEEEEEATMEIKSQQRLPSVFPYSCSGTVSVMFDYGVKWKKSRILRAPILQTSTLVHLGMVCGN